MQEIQNEEQLGQAVAASEGQPVFLFKHSTRCPISAGAKRNVDAYLEKTPDAPPFHMINVVESRPVALKTAERLGVEHQSPQLILLKDGKPVWNASHHAISEGAINNALQQHGQ